MIKLATNIPRKLFLACSGGVDSMVLLDFLLKKDRDITLLHVNHGTEHAKDAEEFVRVQASKFNLKLSVKRIVDRKTKNSSQEEFWRAQRLEFFFSQSFPVLTAHHLDDAVEWWLFSALRGCPRLIPVVTFNIQKPFLLASKEDIQSWAKRKNVEYIEDPTNKENKYARNLIRNNLVPEALKVNPGLRTTIRNMYLKELSI